MAPKFLIALIGSLALSAHADPITFYTESYDVDTLAIADGPPDFESASGPPMPLLSSAVAGIDEYASGGATAASGLLTASSDALGFVGSAYGLGQSHFLGTTQNFGALLLTFDYTNLNFGGLGDMFVLVTNSVVGQLINDDVTTSGARTYGLTIPQGSVTTVDVTVLSQAAADAGGATSNFSQAVISGVVPVPATPFLVIAGLAALLSSRRRRAIAVRW
jgi:hypothetical protein